MEHRPDRVKGFTVVLSGDYKPEYLEEIRNALLMVKEVIAVEYIGSELEDLFARERVRHDVREKLWKTIKEVLDPRSKE